jgi:hypothetical protein
VTKTIGTVHPVTNRTPEEADEHCVRVHTQFARRLYRDHTNCLRDRRSRNVAVQPVLDRRSGQTRPLDVEGYLVDEAVGLDRR